MDSESTLTGNIQKDIIDELSLSEEEQFYINEMQKEVLYKKGTTFLSEGQNIDRSYFVVDGCVRKYYLKDGEEKTTDFFMEKDSITTVIDSSKSMNSKFFLECLEDSTLMVISAQKEEVFYKKFPRFQSLCRISTEQKLEEYQERFSKFIASTPEERYLDILNNRPELLKRVPQYQLASYLGVKPESLSRIKKRLMK